MHTLKVQKKYYNMLKSGTKTIEFRLFDEKRQAIKIGDIIEFTNASHADDKFVAEVVNLYQAEDFEALCQKIDCWQAGFNTNAELIECLAEFYIPQQQKQFGVLGIEIKKIQL